MKPHVIDNLVEKIVDCVARHNLGTPGAYARWLWGENRNLGINEYGCADAANILYTVGYFPTDPEERKEWVSTLQSLQNRETGLFQEPTHHFIHTTAHCSAALELFDAKPLYPCTALQKYAQKENLYHLLEEEIDWSRPWSESHKGAGIFPSLNNTQGMSLEWKNWYFDWLWENADPEIGFWDFGGGRTVVNDRIMEYMAGGFHYMFVCESEHRPYRYPEKMIDFCFKLLEDPATRKAYSCRICTFTEIDIVYAMNRASRQTPYKFWEIKQCLETFAEEYLTMMENIDYMHDESFNDLHMLFGAVCCLAELQAALPGKILSTKPLKLVLDRRPFI